MTPAKPQDRLTGWRMVPVEPCARQLASAILTATFNDPTPADFAVAAAALEFLPPTGHPQGKLVIAELARDYRAMLDGSPAAPTPQHQVEEIARIIDPEIWEDHALTLLAYGLKTFEGAPWPYSGQQRLEETLTKARTILDRLQCSSVASHGATAQEPLPPSAEGT